MQPQTDDEFGKRNAFDVLMGPPAKKAKVDGVVDPIVIAVIYIRWLKWIDPSAPLYGCPYVGQAVRAGNTASEVAAARWAAENSQAMRENKRVGLLRELKVHGVTAFDSQVVEWKQGPRSEVQKWADEREVRLIAEHDGPLRDPLARCKQTLNLTKGGKGNVNFEAMDASRTTAWLQFQDEMEEYVECYGTSLMRSSYVASSGYKLGRRLDGVRQGKLWRGHPDETKRVEWLESLPGWAWNAKETDEWRQANSERAKKQFESQEARDALSERGKAQAAREAAEGKTSLAERGKATRAENWTKEQREAAKAKKAAKNAAKRAVVLAALPDAERKTKQAQYDRADRKEVNRKGKANALLKLPSYADKGYQWCYRNLTQVQKAGVVFSQDRSSGVWSVF